MKKATKSDIERRTCNQKSDLKFFYVLFSITQSLFLLGFSWTHEALIILERATKRTHPRKSPLVSEISIYIYLYYVYYNSTNLSMWVVYTTCVSKNSILNYVIFYLEYNVIRWSSHICKKSSFFSFYSF